MNWRDISKDKNVPTDYMFEIMLQSGEVKKCFVEFGTIWSSDMKNILIRDITHWRYID